MTRTLLVLIVVAILAACAGEEPTESTPQAPHAEAAEVIPPEESEEESGAIQREGVIIYYGAQSGSGLIGELREIYMTPGAGDRAKQIVGDLIAGPNGVEATAVLPRSTRLRQIYVLPDGTAWVDFSADLQSGLAGGSAQELRAVYAIVDSLALNLDEVARVGFLIEGKPIETLTGHLDLRRPLPPDRSLIVRRSSG